MTEARNADDFCYRHPDRRSFVLCQRCLRTVCPECQTQAAVGVICPECMKEQRQATPPRVLRAARVARVRDSRPLMTYGIIGVTVLAYLINLVPGVSLSGYLAFNSGTLYPDGGLFQPWRMVTVVLTHSGIAHIGLNMLALWLLGRSLEPLLGRGRFLALYVLAGIGGSTAVALLAPGTWVVGASGAVFGLFGALLVIGRHIGANITGIAVILGINLVISFVFPGISWQAHVGGLIAGAAVGFLYARTRRPEQRTIQFVGLGAIGVVLIALAFLPVAIG